MDKKLKFSPEGKFRIMCFGDLHERNDYDTKEGRLKTDDYLLLANTALDELKPDLCVFMGDTLTDTDDPDKFEETLRRITAPVTERNIPFAFIMGNHEHDAHKEDMILTQYEKIPGYLGYNDDPSITGDLNYNLLVWSSKEDKPAFNLWFIDSNNLCEDESVSKYDWVHADQIKWYEKKALELKEKWGRIIPAVLFQHTPVAEEYRALRLMKPWELYRSVRGADKYSNNRYMPKAGMKGYLGEGPCSPCYDEGQFDSWKKIGDVKAAIFGHDHLNDFTCTVDGVIMGQCKTAAFRCYTDGCRSSVRLVELDENEPDKVETDVYRFKDFGLKSKSLGPLQRVLCDKQCIALGILAKAALGTAAVIGAAALYKKIRK